MRHLVKWIVALTIVWASWRLLPLGWELLEPHSALASQYGRDACNSVQPWTDLCKHARAVGAIALLDSRYLIDLISQFVDLPHGKIDQGFAAVVGGLAVLGGAYIGFAAPAAEQRRAERKEAEAIAETLADEIGSIAGHIDTQLLEKNAGRFVSDAVKLANRQLPPPKAFQAFIGRIHWIGRLGAAPELVRCIFVWYSYAESIRNQQQQLHTSIVDKADDQVLQSAQQSIVSRLGNLRYGRMWKDLERNFDALKITLQSHSKEQDLAKVTSSFPSKTGDNVIPLRKVS
jgi:hypothetical protein